MSEHSIKNDIDAPVIATTQENDAPLMEIIMNTIRLTPKEINEVNKCRIYLQIFNVSKIVTGDGKWIRNNIWAGERSTDNYNTAIDWPQWSRPTEEKWKLWRYVLRQVLCVHKEKELDTPLGKWYSSPTGWSWFLYDANLIYKQDDKFYFHERETYTTQQ